MDARIISQPRCQDVIRHTTLDGRIENALDRARYELHHNARRLSDSHYVVYSASNDGTEYHVHVTASGLRCSCKAGQYGKVCKHAAKVGLRLRREGSTNVY